MVLLFGSVIILVEAIPRIVNPESVYVEGMILLAIVGVIVNGVSALRLWGGKTQNERVVMLHLLEDVFGWVAVLVVGVVMLFIDLPVLDPILSIVITLYILWNVFKKLRETINIFLQAIPSHVEIKQLETILTEQLPGNSVHDLHLWTMDGSYHVLSFHLVIADNLSKQNIVYLKKQARDILKKHNIRHSTIEIEYEREYCGLANC